MSRHIALALLAACHGPTTNPGTEDPTGGTTPSEAHDPGTRPLQRVNATEYDTIARDLFGTSLRPGQNFPADELSYGFDNIAAALTTSSTHVELWEGAADAILGELFDDTDEETLSYAAQVEGAGVVYSGVGELFDDTYYAIYEGSISVPFSIVYDGDFDITVTAFGRLGELAYPTMDVKIDGVVVDSIELSNAEAKDFVIRADVTTGLHIFEVAIRDPSGDLKRAVIVDRMQVKGPLDPEIGRPAAYAEIVPCAPDGVPSRVCAAEVLPIFGRLAWRRPLTEEEVAWALSLYDTADQALLTEAECLEYAFKGLLMSPEFLYRVERDPEGNATTAVLDGYQTATRLAAFVWSSTPDEALLDAAASGELDTPEGVEAQLDRMMSNPKGAALVDNLAGQWFAVRKLQSTALDTVVYPNYSPDLRDSMATELRLLLQGFFREGRPLDEVFTQQTTWVDARLAELYLLPFDPAQGEWQEVSTVGFERYGLFGTAGWLMAESRSNAPSAVKRGKWILENLLCSAPPPPPPNVEGMVTIVPDGVSVREQEEAQRGDEFCQTCHAQMDPLGWTLHGFAADGSKRPSDELGFPVVNSSVWNGVAMDGPAGMVDAIVADPRLSQCVVEKTFMYALGREVRIEDGPMIESITADFVDNGLSFEALAKAIVTSDAFRMRGVPEVE